VGEENISVYILSRPRLIFLLLQGYKKLKNISVSDKFSHGEVCKKQKFKAALSSNLTICFMLLSFNHIHSVLFLLFFIIILLSLRRNQKYGTTETQGFRFTLYFNLYKEYIFLVNCPRAQDLNKGNIKT